VRLLAFGTYDLRTHPRFAVLLEGMRAHGDEVVEVNVPLGIDTAGRLALLRQPWRLPLLALRIVSCWLRLAWRGRRARRAHRPDAVLVGYLGHFDVHLARLVFGRTPIVLDHLIFAADTARDRGESGGVKTRLLRALDDAALGRADVIVLDTSEHQDMLPARLADRGVVVPVGATRAWFDAGAAAAEVRAEPAAGAAGERVGTLRAVFFGLFTPLQGAETIGRAMALLREDHRVTAMMIGAGQDLAATTEAVGEHPGVSWHGWIPTTDLPEVVAGQDVCLGIFGTGGKAGRVVPNKVYQGAAAGCVIVTADTGPQRRALGDAAVYVPAGDAAALAAALAKLVDDPAEVARLRAAARARAEARFAPDAVVGSLRDHLLARISGGAAT
jgi:glycosyltransferase involved in cell wall biosynthesis